MAKLVGRFRIRDNGHTMRRCSCDSANEEFMNEINEGGDQPADPMKEATKRFKEASDRRWGNGQIIQSDNRRAYADMNPSERFAAASRARRK